MSDRDKDVEISATTWNRESWTFAVTASAYPAVDLSLPRSEAITALVTAYFHRYGPATIRDATWWSFADQAEEALTNEAVTGVQLLAHEDSALKAYHQTRSRAINGRTTPAIQRQIRTRPAALTQTLRTAWAPVR